MKICDLRVWIGLVPMLACTSTTAGSRPRDMSVAQHEAAARQEEMSAASGAILDSSGATPLEPCRPTNGSGVEGALTENQVCWTSVSISTEANRRAMEEHRRRAADHRAGSAALRQAEASACLGISSDDRDISPFDHIEDIESVAPLNDRHFSSGNSYPKFVGATVTFRAVPGMTVEWLQRRVDCHLARNRALGNDVSEMPDCPLVPRGAAALVSSTGSSFGVAIRSDDHAAAVEILARAGRLVAKPAAGKR
jgi:acetylornithine deacetylase/succinyl-diaminopimelate desuccinylase-like protein